MQPSDMALTLYILKVAARCNLNCSYCYMFNLADQSWKHRPALMSDETFTQTLERVRRHCEFTGRESVTFSFHGGEPCLLGPKRFDAWCNRARDLLAGITVHFSLQTNGTLINEEWARMFLKHQVNLGISMDGPQHLHDVFRVDHHGRGSYNQVVRGIGVLRDAQVPFGILSVVQLGADPLAIHHHFLSLGCESLAYLMPDYTHDNIAPVGARYGPTPCADFLIPIFDDWWFNSTIDIRIRNFWDMARGILGGRSTVDALGNRPLNYLVVETDGAIEGLDVLRSCEEGITQTGLNVRDADFREIVNASELHTQMIWGSLPLADVCRACPERFTCGGGYHPHRYSKERGFDNPSVWCADLLRLFAHIRERLSVSVEETAARREALAQQVA